MSEPYSAMLSLRMCRQDLARWLAAPVPAVSRWLAWRGIAGQWRMHNGGDLLLASVLTGMFVFLYFLARDDFKSLGWMLGPFDPNLGYPSDAAPYPSAAWRSSADQPTARRGSVWAALPGHQYAVHQAHVCQRRR